MGRQRERQKAGKQQYEGGGRETGTGKENFGLNFNLGEIQIPERITHPDGQDHFGVLLIVAGTPYERQTHSQ